MAINGGDSGDNANANANTVSWQSAYWALVPLALNTMTQPCGTVLLFPTSLRTYLRSSPVICLFDSLAIILQLGVYIATSNSHHNDNDQKDNLLLLSDQVCKACEKIVERRFNSKHSTPMNPSSPPSSSAATSASGTEVSAHPDEAYGDDGEEEGFQGLEKLTFVRWTLFILGSLPQAFKLLALSGVPGTKALGMMYMISFLVVEFAVVLAGKGLSRLRRKRGVLIPLSRYDQEGSGRGGIVEEDPRAERREKILVRIDLVCTALGVLFHMALLFWAWILLCELALASEDVGLGPWLRNIYTVIHSLAILAFLCLCVSKSHSRVAFLAYWIPRPLRSLQRLLLAHIVAILGINQLLSPFDRPQTRLSGVERYKRWCSSVLILMLLYKLLLYFIIRFVAPRSKAFRTRVLLVPLSAVEKAVVTARSSVTDAAHRVDNPENVTAAAGTLQPEQPGQQQQTQTRPQNQEEGMRHKSPDLEVHLNQSAGLWIAFLLNIFIPLLWYRFRYDPQGTFKPAWTNNLG